MLLIMCEQCLETTLTIRMTLVRTEGREDEKEELLQSQAMPIESA